MKKEMIIAALSLMASAFTVAHGDQQKMTQDASRQNMQCTSLSSEEQLFSKQLNASNQALFCSKFNADQRSSAMQMAGRADINGKMMTADQAVQKVAMDNNMMMTPPREQQSQPKNQGCPVK